MKGGATVEKEVIYPKGHAKAPMSEAEVIAKFNTMTSGRLNAVRRSQVIDCILRFDEARGVSDVLGLLVN
jgi:2-methylcitrate dehydratase PrpD